MVMFVYNDQEIVHMFQEVWSLLCRGRKKRNLFFIIILMILMIAIMYLSYNLIHTWILR